MMGKGNLTKLTDALHNEWNFTYDDSGNLLTATDPEGNTFAASYDSDGRLVEGRDAVGNVTRFMFDRFSRLTSVLNALNQESRVRVRLHGPPHANGQSLREYWRTGLRRQWECHRDIDANGKQTQYAYEVGNQLTQIADPAGGSTRFSYESAECSSCGVTVNLAALIDAKNAIWSYEYDSRSLGTQTRDPLGNTERLAYDARENLLAKTDSNGAAVRFDYDGNNRLVRKAYPDGAETRFGYDVNRNLVSASNQHVTYTFSYDALNRLTSVQDSRYSQPTQYTYDRAGRSQSDDRTGWWDYVLHIYAPWPRRVDHGPWRAINPV